MLAKKKMRSNELADRMGITTNLSILKPEKQRRFGSRHKLICEILECQPGDILEFVRDE
jgi:putative transcriptional regulator